MKNEIVASNMRDLFRWVLRSWPLLLVAGFIGAAAGMLFSMTHPPLYQAEAVLGVVINYGITEPLELVVEDRTLGRVVALINSDETLSVVFERIPQEIREMRGWVTHADLRSSFRMDRRLEDWWLSVVDLDPKIASEVAQIWAEASIEELDEAVQHAWRALAMMSGPFDVECEPIEVEEESLASPLWQCQVVPIELDPATLDGTLQTEIRLSRGILPNIAYELLQAAHPPEKPVLWGRGSLVLGGGLAGLIAGSVLSLILSWRNKSRRCITEVR